MKTLSLSSLFAAALVFGAAPTASANDLSYSVSLDYVSEYVFRGVTLAGEAFQPGAEVSYGNFTAGVWASVASGEESIFFGDEIDFYAGYSFDVSELISADVGVTLYHYPQAGGLFDIGASKAGTLEPYVSFGFDTVLAPSLSAYYDLNLDAFTLEGGVEHSIPMADKWSLDMSAAAGFVTIKGGGDYQYGSASAAVSYGVNDNASIYVGGNFGLSSEDTFADISFDPTNLATIDPPSDNSLWFGIGTSIGF